MGFQEIFLNQLMINDYYDSTNTNISVYTGVTLIKSKYPVQKRKTRFLSKDKVLLKEIFFFCRVGVSTGGLILYL